MCLFVFFFVFFMTVFPLITRHERSADSTVSALLLSFVMAELVVCHPEALRYKTMHAKFRQLSEKYRLVLTVTSGLCFGVSVEVLL